jgi:hypothetical protein
LTLPTYAAAIAPSTPSAVEADLLSRLDPTSASGWPADSPQMRLLAAVSTPVQFEQVQRALLARASSPTTARGLRAWLVSQGYAPADAAAIASSWIDALILAWFDELRIPALAAVWDVPMVASAPTIVGAASALVLQADDGTLFVSAQAADVTLGASPALVRFRARAAGVVGNVSPSTITRIIAAPATVSISGAATLVTAGRDAEGDEAAIARCLGKWVRLGAGWTAAAFDYLIPTAAPTITRWLVRDDNPFGAGTVGVWLANAAGPATPTEVTSVLAYLARRDVRPLGSGGVYVVTANAVAVALSVTILGDGSNPTLAADAQRAIEALADACPVGPFVLVSEVLNAVTMGGEFPAGIPIPVVADGSVTVQTHPDLPGFGGAVALLPPETNPHMIGYGEVLLMTVSVTVVASA